MFLENVCRVCFWGGGVNLIVDLIFCYSRINIASLRIKYFSNLHQYLFSRQTIP